MPAPEQQPNVDSSWNSDMPWSYYAEQNGAPVVNSESESDTDEVLQLAPPAAAIAKVIKREWS